ncbi:hypothetical protein QGM61_10705 [Pseudohongiella sp. SYSU M77423]|uniref:hypothetical protein n=1 Tax=Pseudohongiella sp. SYSU M77423 TaxID=3042312 RepID=UPI0024805D57|nr:hypothetical protein [Pseudohongiella sp. SYSU M77423]MDH7944290.1 hypothetical protein [Pseudohongiella sp. SYSU M77423]MEC8859742.1 hypothetical protein [Pseudomonadota bacterium]
MSANDFWMDIQNSEWHSVGGSTVRNKQFNPFPDDDWRAGLVRDNEPYYPPSGVHIKIKSQEETRGEYSVDHHGKPEQVPATKLRTFTLEISGDDFLGKEALSAARFLVVGDHAISSPLTLSSTKSVVVLVRLYTASDGKQVMVNELIWSVQYDKTPGSTKTFYDIQKWFCCRYP